MGKNAAMVLLVVIGGCRLLIDVDTAQCEQDRDCRGQVGDDYVCGSQGVCVIDPDLAECTTDTDCQELMGSAAVCDMGMCAEGVRLPDRYSCLEEGPTAPANSSGMITVKVGIVDFTTQMPPSGITVNACNAKDVNCDDPVADQVAANSDGVVSIELPRGFAGYFEVNTAEFVPALFSVNRPLYDDLTLPGPSLLKPDILQALAAMGQDTLEEDTAIVIADLVDCDGQAAPGVIVGVSGDDTLSPFYIEGVLPDRMLPSTRISDQIGVDMIPRAVAGFTNVTPGYTTLTAKLVDPEYPYTTTTVALRQNTMTFVRIYAGDVR